MLLSLPSANSYRKLLALTALLGGLLGASLAKATTVQIQTVMGDIVVNLFDKGTPITVQNFLSYVNAGAYSDTIIHRSVENFAIQGGGYSYDGTLPPKSITRNAAIVNEPVYSNVRGTIAMAKLSGNLDSATSEWFINTVDNTNLDSKTNGGFSVFGQVISGMDVVDAIATVNRFNMGSPFNTIPLRNYTSEDYANNVTVTGDNFVMVTGVVVLDANPGTADGLTPVPNKKYSTSSGGGTEGWLLLLLSALVCSKLLRRRKINS